MIGAAWIYRYWSRDKSYFAHTLPRVAERLPSLLQENVSRRGVEGVLEAPALTLWALGPIVLPIVVAGCAVAFVGLRRGRRWARAATLVLAVAAIPVAYGGVRALRHIEDRHYYARSPYVRTYHYLVAPLVVASAVLVVLVIVDGTVLARRRARAA